MRKLWAMLLAGFLSSGCSVTFEVQMSTGKGGMQEVAETKQETEASVDTGL